MVSNMKIVAGRCPYARYSKLVTNTIAIQSINQRTDTTSKNTGPKDHYRAATNTFGLMPSHIEMSIKVEL